MSFCDPGFADALRLTSDQKDRLHEIEDESVKMLWRPPGKHGDHRPGPGGWKHSEEFWQGVNDRLMNVLSDEQKAQWKDLMGEPFKGDIRFGPPPPDFGRRPHDEPPMENE